MQPANKALYEVQNKQICGISPDIFFFFFMQMDENIPHHIFIININSFILNQIS